MYGNPILFYTDQNIVQFRAPKIIVFFLGRSFRVKSTNPFSMTSSDFLHFAAFERSIIQEQNKKKINLGQKKLIICFSGTARVTFNPPASKIFIAFPVFTFENRLHIANCQFRSAVICRHFVC